MSVPHRELSEKYTYVGWTTRSCDNVRGLPGATQQAAIGSSVSWLVGRFGWLVGWLMLCLFVDIFVCLFFCPCGIHLISLTFRCLWFGPIPVTPESSPRAVCGTAVTGAGPQRQKQTSTLKRKHQVLINFNGILYINFNPASTIDWYQVSRYPSPYNNHRQKPIAEHRQTITQVC